MGPLFDTISACVSTQVRIALPFNRTLTLVGATAYIYLFMSASYHSTANTEETSSQISLMAQYKKFQVQGSSQTADMYAQIKETFKQSTSAVIEYHPPVDLHGEENQTEWK